MEAKEGLRLARDLIESGSSYENAIKTLSEKTQESGISEADIRVWVYQQPLLELRKRLGWLNRGLLALLAVNLALNVSVNLWALSRTSIWSEWGTMSVLTTLTVVVVPIGMLAPLMYFVSRYRRMAYIACFIVMTWSARDGGKVDWSFQTLEQALAAIGLMITLVIGALSVVLIRKMFPKLTWMSQAKTD